MFTGIITERGHIIDCVQDGDDMRLVVAIGHLAANAEIGDSIAHNGVCLTVTTLDDGKASFDVSAETLRKTCMADWKPGVYINLEAALRLGDKLGGHMVSGHVDGVGTLLARQSEGDSERFTFSLPADGSVRVVEKGSICVDGISLTCFNCSQTQFDIAVIPHTLQVTNLGTMQVGTAVHLEQDMIGRWVAAMMPQP